MPRTRYPLERRSGPPDFVGVGAEGPAGDWWREALLAHPQILGPRGDVRGLDYFREYCAREMEHADILRYHRRFRHRPRTVSGEWTGSYMSDGWVPPLLHRAAPDAKLLVMLSDPIDRYRAVFAERKAAQADRARIAMTDVADRARYASGLGRLRRYYGSDRILVLQYERCRSAPLAEYRRTLRFLGVSDDARPKRLRRRSEGARTSAPGWLPPAPPSQPAPPLWPDLEAALHTALDPEVQELSATLPEFDMGLWSNFAELAVAGAPVRRPRA
jgi:hypothetical protein